MAYTPTEWATGDVITAEKLNNIEDGIVANEEAIADAELVIFKGKAEMNPQTMTYVDNSFQLLEGDVSDLGNPHAVMELDMYMTGGTVQLAKLILPYSVDVMLDLSTQQPTSNKCFSMIADLGGNVVLSVVVKYLTGTSSWDAEIHSLAS